METNVISEVMNEARKCGLESEVRATAIAIMMENPNVDSGSAYSQAAYEWDIYSQTLKLRILEDEDSIVYSK